MLNSLLIGFVLGQIFKVPVTLRAGLQYGEKFILSPSCSFDGLRFIHRSNYFDWLEQFLDHFS